MRNSVCIKVLAMTSKPRAAVSIDFELFRHTPAFRSANETLTDETLGLEAVNSLLTAFDSADATATFFVVSEIAEGHPAVIKRIAAAGHEIASHTHSHRLLTDISVDERRYELRRSREILESTTGQSVRGFRAPAFALPEGYFTALAAAGYDYDSSINPCRAIPGWYGGEHDIQRATAATAVDPTAPADLTELPIAVSPYVRLPVSGAWTRLLGRQYTLWGTQAVADRGVSPVLYFHPWEFVNLPDIAGVPRRVTWRTGEWMCETLDRILSLPLDFVSTAELAAEPS
jgi:peptidoglycan/xylan/chitin deacetylase (PgdA/CDA1 family)